MDAAKFESRLALFMLVVLVIVTAVGFGLQYHDIGDLQRRIAVLEERR